MKQQLTFLQQSVASVEEEKVWFGLVWCGMVVYQMGLLKLRPIMLCWSLGTLSWEPTFYFFFLAPLLFEKDMHERPLLVFSNKKKGDQTNVKVDGWEVHLFPLRSSFLSMRRDHGSRTGYDGMDIARKMNHHKWASRLIRSGQIAMPA